MLASAGIQVAIGATVQFDISSLMWSGYDGKYLFEQRPFLLLTLMMTMSRSTDIRFPQCGHSGRRGGPPRGDPPAQVTPAPAAHAERREVEELNPRSPQRGRG
jgi:hypothetical protein